MKLAPVALCAGFCAAAFSQSYDTFRAEITGTSSDRGKCTIEVVIDGVAEIEVSAKQAGMRTLSGARSAWKRLDCNMAIPPKPADFRFSPAKGQRGKQTLVHEPSANGGTAVVRIEDPEVGSKAYKFALEWRGVKNGFEDGGLRNSRLEPSGQGGVIDDGSLAGWSGRIEFRGTGEGYYHSYNGIDSLLTDSEVIVEPSGHVEIRLMTKQKSTLRLTGRLVKADKNQLVANVSGGAFAGPMNIGKDNRNRIKTLSMTGEGRNKFELRWQSLK